MMAALDSRKSIHKEIYDRLLSSYNDKTKNAISGFANPEIENFHLVDVCNNLANDFDCISSADFSDAMGYLSFHYQAAKEMIRHQGFMMTLLSFLATILISFAIICGSFKPPAYRILQFQLSQLQ
jgi:hypothetical protein